VFEFSDDTSNQGIYIPTAISVEVEKWRGIHFIIQRHIIGILPGRFEFMTVRSRNGDGMQQIIE